MRLLHDVPSLERLRRLTFVIAVFGAAVCAYSLLLGLRHHQEAAMAAFRYGCGAVVGALFSYAIVTVFLVLAPER